MINNLINFNEKSSNEILSTVKSFEKLTGITGISADYKFPEDDKLIKGFKGLSCYTLFKDHDEFSKKMAEPLYGEWGKLVELNSELEKVEIDKDDFWTVVFALKGVCNDLNVDDINHSINEDTVDPLLVSNMNFLLSDITPEDQDVAFSVDWNASKETLEKIGRYIFVNHYGYKEPSAPKA